MVQEDGYYAVVGVTNYAFGCGEPGFPGVYARVTARLDWILAKTQGTQDTSCATTTTAETVTTTATVTTTTTSTTTSTESSGQCFLFSELCC